MYFDPQTIKPGYVAGLRASYMLDMDLPVFKAHLFVLQTLRSSKTS